HNRIAAIPDADKRERALRRLGIEVWRRVGDCLSHRKASRRLVQARKAHRLRLAGFDYGFGEGPFRLTELNSSAAKRQCQSEGFALFCWLRGIPPLSFSWGAI